MSTTRNTATLTRRIVAASAVAVLSLGAAACSDDDGNEDDLDNPVDGVDDQLDDIARRHPRVSFAAMSIRGDLGDVRALVRGRRWGFPVGYDTDGILANAYGVAVCPQITFLRRGGAVQDTSLGVIAAADLDARVGRLER